MGIVWSGVEALKNSFERIQKEADEAAREVAVKSAALIETRAKNNFVGSHPYGTPRPANADPNKPMVVTGNLRRSITSSPATKNATASYTVTVAPTAIYARRVELGYNGSRGYPYFMPAVRESHNDIANINREVWSRVFGK